MVNGNGRDTVISHLTELENEVDNLRKENALCRQRIVELEQDVRVLNATKEALHATINDRVLTIIWYSRNFSNLYGALRTASQTLIDAFDRTNKEAEERNLMDDIQEQMTLSEKAKELRPAKDSNIATFAPPSAPSDLVAPPKAPGDDGRLMPRFLQGGPAVGGRTQQE